MSASIHAPCVRYGRRYSHKPMMSTMRGLSGCFWCAVLCSGCVYSSSAPRDEKLSCHLQCGIRCNIQMVCRMVLFLQFTHGGHHIVHTCVSWRCCSAPHSVLHSDGSGRRIRCSICPPLPHHHLSGKRAWAVTGSLANQLLSRCLTMNFCGFACSVARSPAAWRPVTRKTWLYD
jgi:hypothetical protein